MYRYPVLITWPLTSLKKADTYLVTVDKLVSLFNCTPLDRDSYKASCFSWMGLDLGLSVAWSFGVQLVVFFCSCISVVLFDPKISTMFLSHLYL